MLYIPQFCSFILSSFVFTLELQMVQIVFFHGGDFDGDSCSFIGHREPPRNLSKK